MAKGKGRGGMILIVTTIIGVSLLSFGLIQLNFDLSFIGFDITGNVTAGAIPEINEDSQKLLGGIVFVGESNVIETSNNFALAQSFTITSPTVITDFAIRIATEDPDVIVRGFIWNIDQAPPRRIAISPDVFNGTEIGTVLRDVSFTFPQALVIEPTFAVSCVTAPCPAETIDYAVGIRVDQNLAGSFTYGFNETESSIIEETTSGGVVVTPLQIFPSSHQSKIDITVAGQPADFEQLFRVTEPFGVIAIDIFHNANFGVELMEELEETLMDNSTATEEEQEVACIAIHPPPPECEGDNVLDPQECGIAEELMNGICICKEGFEPQLLSDGAGGTDDVCLMAVETTTVIPPQLQVPPRVDPIVFIGLGGAIIAISIIGIGVRAIRK